VAIGDELNPNMAIKASEMSKRGVSTEPNKGTIRFFLIASRKIIEQQARLKTQSGVEGTRSLNAPWATVKHLAKTPNGPIRERAIRGNQNLAGFPSLPKKSFELPLKRNIAKTPRKGTTIPVRRIPRVANPMFPSEI